jgi:hypothetical protein
VAALAEMRRALKPTGRIAASVWCDIEHCPPFSALSNALGAVLGAEAQLAYRELAGLFDEAGFAHARVERRELPITFEGGPGQLLATLPTAAVAPQVAALDARGRDDLLAATTEALQPLLHDGAVRSQMSAHVVLATR